MLNSCKSVLMTKQTHLHLGWPVGEYIYIFVWKLMSYMLRVCMICNPWRKKRNTWQTVCPGWKRRFCPAGRGLLSHSLILLAGRCLQDSTPSLWSPLWLAQMSFSKRSLCPSAHWHVCHRVKDVWQNMRPSVNSQSIEGPSCS